MKAHRTRHAAAIAAITLLAAAPVAAQSPDDARNARRLGQQGHEALGRNDHPQAAERYAKAYELTRDATYLLGLGRAQVGMGKLAAARTTYQAILDDKEARPGHAKLADVAARELEALTPHLAWITIELAGAADAKVTLDDQEVKRAALGETLAIDPGKHVVRVRGDGLTADETFIVSAGEERTVKLTLRRLESSAPAPAPAPEPPPASPPPPPPASAQRALGIVALAVGGAGVATGAAFGALALGARSDLKGGCVKGLCGPEYHATIDEYRTFGMVSTVGFAAGAVGLGLGVVLMATAPSAPSAPSPKTEAAKARVMPYVGLGNAGAVGSF